MPDLVRAYRPERPRDTLADYLAALWASRKTGWPMLAVFPLVWVFAVLLDGIWPTPVFGV